MTPTLRETLRRVFVGLFGVMVTLAFCFEPNTDSSLAIIALGGAVLLTMIYVVVITGGKL